MFDHCPRTETWLAQLGVRREYHENVSYDEFRDDWKDVNKGRPNSARVEEAVLNYAEQAASGSPAPAVILRKIDGELEVLDGCQRLLANELNGSRHCAAYVVTCDDDTAKKIRIAANQRLHSQAPVSKKWTITQMVENFIIHGHETPTEVATCLGVAIAEVNEVILRERTRSMVRNAFPEHLKQDSPTLEDGKLDAIAKVAEREDFEGRAGKFTCRAINDMVRARLNNGAFTQKITELLSPRRLKSKDRGTQLKTQFNKCITQDAALQARLSGTIKKGKLDRVLQTLKQLVTVSKNYKTLAKTCPLDDMDIADQMHQQFQEAGRVLRECCSTRVRNHINHPDGPFCT